jgi:hypothetical protein
MSARSGIFFLCLAPANRSFDFPPIQNKRSVHIYIIRERVVGFDGGISSCTVEFSRLEFSRLLLPKCFARSHELKCAALAYIP